MDQLRQQVARARRRLILEQFLGRLVWCLLGAFTLATFGIAAPRIVAFENLPANWDMVWLVGSFVAGGLAAIVWTYIKCRSSLDAAIEIDRRFDLRERIASSLSLSSEQQSTEAGQALLNDAVRAVSRLDVEDKFRVRVDRCAWLPLLPAVAAFILVAFVDYRSAQSGLDPAASAAFEQHNKTAAESLRKKIEELRKKEEVKKLEAADKIFKQIELGAQELAKAKDVDRTKATAKLNDLAKQLQEKREQLGGKDSLKEQFKNMKNLGAGPAEKASQALKQGDWQQAMKEFEKLAKDLKAGKLSDADKEKLMKQLEQMKEKLQAANDARQQAMDNLEKQIEQQKQQGNLAKAGELQQKLDQLKKQQQNAAQMQKMAAQLSQMQQSLQQGDSQAASEAMQQMASQLSEMQQDMDNLEMLDLAMQEIEMTKDALGCQSCTGEGCSECQGGGSGQGKDGRKGSKGGGNGGTQWGVGTKRGQGERSDENTPTNLRDTRVRAQPKQGAAIYTGSVEGPNLKGEVAQSIKQEIEATSTTPADPLTNERLSKSRREHAEQYFQILREGKK